MSEVQSRPVAARGRGSGRGGRGGLSTRGGRSATRSNGDSQESSSSLPSLEDEGEIGQLKKQYGSKVAIIKEMFPDWSDVDVLFALNETDGDESLAVTRIAEGTSPTPILKVPPPLLACLVQALPVSARRDECLPFPVVCAEPLAHRSCMLPRRVSHPVCCCC